MSTENNSIRNALVIVSTLAMVIALLYLLNSLFNVVGSARQDEGVAEHVTKAADQRIKPVGEVTAGNLAIKPAARTAKDIVTNTCAACHGTGAMGAPKIGNKADWNARVASGFDGLMKSAINGKGMMPARGGDASLSDKDIENAINYMLKESGI